MADKSAIEWTDATWNPIRARNIKTGKVGWHCEHATTGCKFCYAEGFNRRLGTGLAFKPAHRKDIEIFLDEEMLLQPLRWKRPRMIFVCSMTDLFADFVPDQWIDKMFAVMELAPQHTFQVLTKRSERMKRYLTNADAFEASRAGVRSPGFTIAQRVQALCADYVRLGKFQINGFGPVYPEDWRRAKPRLRTMPLSNVWLGVSAERQPEWDERVEHLGATPAAVRFVSVEPMLGYIDCGNAFDPPPEKSPFRPIDWIICGGESGSRARPMHPQWARSLRDQCEAAGFLDRFFFKQWGSWEPRYYFDIPDAKGRSQQLLDLKQTRKSIILHASEPKQFPVNMVRVGKKKAGRELDGELHNGMPAVPA